MARPWIIWRYVLKDVGIHASLGLSAITLLIGTGIAAPALLALGYCYCSTRGELLAPEWRDGDRWRPHAQHRDLGRALGEQDRDDDARAGCGAAHRACHRVARAT